MLEALQQLDTELFLWINGHHCTGMDWPMWVLSQHWFFVAVLVIAFFALTTQSFHLSPFTFHLERRWWLLLLAIGLCFLLADQGSVQLFKNTVCRLRPCHAIEDVYMFRTGCGGRYGFVSSHAANAFALIVFLSMCRRRTLFTLLMCLWGVAICYSRVYLGKHYPGDVVCGAFFGAVIGLVVWKIYNWIEKKFALCETK